MLGVEGRDVDVVVSVAVCNGGLVGPPPFLYLSGT